VTAADYATAAYYRLVAFALVGLVIAVVRRFLR
jgi:hypothetical protein